MTTEHTDDLLLAYLDAHARHDAMLEQYFPPEALTSGRTIEPVEPLSDEALQELARLAEEAYAAQRAWHQSRGR